MGEQLSQDVLAAGRMISRCITSLPPSHARFEPKDVWLVSILARNMVYTASMYIEGISAVSDAAANVRCLSAARRIVGMARDLKDEDPLRLPLFFGVSFCFVPYHALDDSLCICSTPFTFSLDGLPHSTYWQESEIASNASHYRA